MMLKLILFFILNLFALCGYAQEAICKTNRINHAALLKAESMTRQNRGLYDDKLIRVYFRIFRNDNGSNAAATLAEIDSEFAQLQTSFQGQNICFANMGVEFIHSSNLNTGINVDDPSTYSALFQFLVPGCITIFYHSNLTGAGGYAYDIPNVFLSIERSYIGAQNTISHEVGHCLGLMHTHETTYGFENINGDDCTQNGDRVCDTPADPWCFKGILPCFSNVNCLYTGTCMDPNGATSYHPPYTNIMSYWSSVGCERVGFTTGQIARAHSYLFTDTQLLLVQSPGTLSYGPVTHTSGLVLKTAINSLSTIDNVTLSNTTTANFQSTEIILNPGFTAAPTSGQVIIKPVSCVY